MDNSWGQPSFAYLLINFHLKIRMNRAPTTVSIPPIRRVGGQSGMGVEYEETDSDGEM